MRDASFTMFLLSPANLSGQRAKMVHNPNAAFPLAQQLRSEEGAPLGDVFSFISGLYFRGKKTYAETFGRAPEGLSAGLVISPGEGLRFLYERVTVARLLKWAEVSIDEGNTHFTRPLMEHADALNRVHGKSTRFVLLGSIATDKYVHPLSQIFGDQLLFPADFVGRGDMSRGALLLRSARAERELAYVPIAGALRHGPRAKPLSRTRRNAPHVVIFVGLPACGKTSFFQHRFAEAYVHVSKDNFRNNGRPAHRQTQLLKEALAAGRSLVVDNTNASVEERAPVIADARVHGARIIGYYFDADTRSCAARNRERQGRARIPNVGIFATAKRLVQPQPEEGFHELYSVKLLGGGRFEVTRVDGG